MSGSQNISRSTIGVEPHESGAIILLFAAIITTLFILASIAIDGSRLLVSAQEKQYSAEEISIAVLQAYLDSNALTHSDKLANALTRGEQISSVAHNYVEDRAEAELGELIDRSAGTVYAGIWWTELPDSCVIATCPCSTTLPCFQECGPAGCVDPSTGADGVFARAFRVSLRTKESAPISNFLGSIMGAPTSRVSSEVAVQGSQIAAVAPKNGMVLIDISAGAALDTHDPAGRNLFGTNEKRLKYDIFNPTYDCSLFPPEDPWGLISSDDSDETNSYASLTAAEKSRYQCLHAPARYYRQILDTQVDAEPMSTLFDALRRYIDSFNLNGFDFDRLGVYGVGALQRGWENTEQEHLRYFPSAAKNSPILESVKSVVRRYGDYPLARNEIAMDRINHYFYPYYSNPGADIEVGISKAVSYLKQSRTFRSSDNFILLLAGSIPAFRFSPAENPGWDVGYDLTQANLDALESTAQRLKDDGIALHVVFAGEKLGSHLMLYPSIDSAGCMSLEEMKKRNYPYTALPTETLTDRIERLRLVGKPGASPYFDPVVRLSRMVSKTGGSFLAVRPICPVGTAAQLNAACDLARRVGQPVKSTDDAPLNPLDWSVRDPGLAAAGILDGDGRLFCEAYASDPLDAAVALFQQLYREREFILVQ